jgi:hypothetical protein
LSVSSSATTRHLVFWPLRLADISHNSSVYWITCKVRAMRRYVGDFCVQN